MNTILTTMLLAVSNPAPALVVDNPLRNTGVFKGGSALKQLFLLRNSSTAGTIEILGVDGTCGCVRQSLSSREIAPGQTADLAIEINTLTQPDGANTWRFSVRYRHLDRESVLSLVLSATLVREVLVTPPMMAVTTSQETTQEFTVTDRRAIPLAITGVATSVPFLRAEVAPSNSPGKSTIRVIIAENTPLGVHDATVSLTTSDPVYAELKLPIRITRQSRDAIRAYPEQVDLRLPSETESAIRVVQFRRPDSQPIVINKADCSTPGVILKWSKSESSVATLRIEISPAVAGLAGKASVQVQFQGNSELSKTIAVEWTGP